ncbi:MAG TPA: diguanylate cyclase [Steroidobacteraceae bacterium]|nr:diguanylate cyclase [Steroidobacteraceae bacterium]
MFPRYRPLAIYSLLLAAAAGGWLAWELAGAAAFPAAWIVVLCVLFNLFVFQFGVPAPWVGLTSMERLPQVGLLLVLPPPVAAVICGLASAIWPLVSRGYSHGSRVVAVIRAIHNAGMTALMILIAGYAYLAAGGRHPLDGFATADLLPLAAMALTMQAVNIALMALFYRFDGRDVSKLITPIYSLMDLIFVPAGVLAAVLYNAAHPATFALFMVLMVVFVLSFSGVGRALSSEDAERSPIARLLRAGRALHGARQLDEVGSRILAETRTLFRFDEFYLVLVDRELGQLDFRVHELRGERQPAARRPLDEGLFGWVVESGEPVLVADWSRAPERLRQRALETGKETGSVIVVPLQQDGAIIGLLSVQHTEAQVYSVADLHLLQRLAEHVAAAVADARAFEDLEDYRLRLEERVAQRTAELEKAGREKERLIAALREHSSELERESREDALTGISNRRHFMQRLATEFEVALAVGHPLTVAIADLDRFKIVNDRLGHTVGDEALKRSAVLMREHCRDTDVIARIGGEEFAMILPGMPLQAAIEFCDRIRSAIEAHDWRAVHPQLRVTISIGVWQWDGRADSTALIEAADAQLYRAKREGRNRVA